MNSHDWKRFPVSDRLGVKDPLGHEFRLTKVVRNSLTISSAHYHAPYVQTSNWGRSKITAWRSAVRHQSDIQILDG